jgi:hypothetical protein
MARESSKFLEDVEFIGMYKNKLSLRFYFASPDKNLTDKEAAGDLKIIESRLDK